MSRKQGRVPVRPVGERLAEAWRRRPPDLSRAVRSARSFASARWIRLVATSGGEEPIPRRHVMTIGRDHPNLDVERNLIRARDIRAAYLRGLLLWMAVRTRDWVARRLGDRTPRSTGSAEPAGSQSNSLNSESRFETEEAERKAEMFG
jgi:hypothetical protein